MNRFIAIAATALLVAVAAGCGGGSKSSHGVAGAQKMISTSAQARITQTWIAFFSGSTPAAEKVKLLQNGQRFAAVIRAEAASPLAKQTKAAVTKVTMQGPTRAQVLYSISLAGKPALQHQVGLAVLSHGVWQVGDASFCALLGLQGKPPPGCPK